ALPEVHGGGIHGLERHVSQGQLDDLVLGLLQHLLGEVDAGEVTVGGIDREVQARADADREDTITPLDVEQADGRLSSRMEDPVEDEVVGGRVQLVCPLDLSLLQRGVQSGSPPRYSDTSCLRTFSIG